MSSSRLNKLSSPKNNRASLHRSKISSDKFQYFTDSSEEISNSEDEEAKNALNSLISDVQQLGNELNLLKGENSVLKEQLRLSNIEKKTITSREASMKQEFEAQINNLKLTLNQREDSQKTLESEFTLQKKLLEESLDRALKERERERIKFIKQIEKIKSGYKAKIEEKDNKINLMKSIIGKTKNLEKIVKSIMGQDDEGLQSRSMKTLPSGKKSLHSKSKSYAPVCSKQIEEICKTIVSLEKEQAELRQTSFENPSIKTLIKNNSEKIKELRIMQEELFKDERS